RGNIMESWILINNDRCFCWLRIGRQHTHKKIADFIVIKTSAILLRSLSRPLAADVLYNALL
ncbi:hypothetical protein M8C21_004281, partial [Ambrosia artemisiifolia]